MLRRDRTYRHLFAAQIVALVGTGFLTVALSLLAFDVAPDSAGAVVATALTIKMVAYVGLAPLITATTTRFEPRSVLVAADLVRGAVALSLPWITEVWQIYVLVFLLQAASATFTPTYQATLPAVLPDEDDYTRALSLSRLAYDLESVLSPALAALALTMLTFHHLFWVTAVGFAGSALLVRSAELVVDRVVDPTPFLRRATAGVALFMRTPTLRALLAVDLAVSAASAVVLVNTVVVVREDLRLDESALAVTLGAYGAGSMVVALATPAALRRITDRALMLSGAVGAPIALGLAAIATHGGRWPAVLGAWLLLGAAASAMLTPSGRVVNRSVRADQRPAAFAASFSLSHACFLVAYPLAGWSGAQLGAPASALVLAAVAAAAAASALVMWREQIPTVAR